MMPAFAVSSRGIVLLLIASSLSLGSCGSPIPLQDVRSLSEGDHPCARYGCEGSFVAGIAWNDALGENAFIISEKREESEEGERLLLTATRYVMHGPKPKSSWQGVYSGVSPCDPGEGIVGDIEVSDLNEDGVAEVLFVYNVEGNCDVSPKEYGLVLHGGTAVYEVTGTDNLKVNRGVPGNGGMVFSPSFASAPKSFRNRAAEAWKRIVPGS